MNDTDTTATATAPAADPAATADDARNQADTATKAADGGEADPDPMLELEGRVERLEEALSAANGQLLLVAEKLVELGLAPESDYAIGETAAAVLGQQAADLFAAAAAAAKPRATAGKGGAKPRKISAKAVKSPVTAKQDAEGNVTSVAVQLGELIQLSDVVEVVCSDGELEIVGIAPQRITGGAWRVSQVGLQLTLEQLLIAGPAVGAAPYEIRGYGLLLDGELVHFQPRSDALEVMGGSTSNIAPDVCLS